MTFPPGIQAIVKNILIVIVCSLFFSCVPTLRVPEAPTYAGPVNIEVLKERRILMNVRSLRSEVKVKLKRGKKHLGSLKGAFLFEQPDFVRLRVFNPFGSGGVDVLHSDGLLQVLLLEQGILYEGASPAAKSELSYYMDAGDKHYKLLALKPEDWGTSIFASYSFDKRTLLNTKLTMYKGGKTFVVMMFRDFIDGVPMRAKIDLFNGYTMYMELIQPEVDVDISPELFELYEHMEIKVLPLERLINEGM